MGIQIFWKDMLTSRITDIKIRFIITKANYKTFLFTRIEQTLIHKQVIKIGQFIRTDTRIILTF